MYDDIAEHYDAITDIKAVLAGRHFCFNCFKSFTDKDAFLNHECGVSNKIKKGKLRHADKMLDELPHTLISSFTKGSCEEIEQRTRNVKNSDKTAKKRDIWNPRYIIYDFETDTSSDQVLKPNSDDKYYEIHKPNHVEYDLLQIDEELTHDYENCLIKTSNFSGYNCADEFCEWLFTEDNYNTTVIAHNGAGYDNKFILKWCITKKGLLPSSFIRQGSRITYMSFEKFRIRFVDSYIFLCNH